MGYTKVDGPTGNVLMKVHKERLRQNRLKEEGRFKFTCADPDLTNSEKLVILAEELGEVARCVSERSGLVNDVHGDELDKELCQVAAVCVAWMESL